jgi:cation diffusion facilitator CzcD-associated flavoprotein CzcO
MQRPSGSKDENTVAIIGAGPGGLVTARWLAQHGFEPVLFEAANALGGQWNRSNPASRTWDGMRTNTSRVMSAFSDLDHAPEVGVYPRQDQMLDYLESYALSFDLVRRIRFGTRIERLERTSTGRWLVRHVSAAGVEEQSFANAVVATGPQAAPAVPDVPGLDSFTGILGTRHTAQYDGAERYRGRSVLVAGCSISALEIASDLAFAGAREVITTYRRQRYVLPKLIAGVPTDHVMFSRAAALAAEVAPPEALAGHLKAAVLRAGGSPEQFGAPAPDANIFAAGITQAQHYLPAVAEGRITMRPWIDRVEKSRVFFKDGSSMEPDAILLGTGYRISLPWLAPDIGAILNAGGESLDLHLHTFHPDLPGLAFVGLYNLVGPYLPVLELQARWIAYTLAGLVPVASKDAMTAGVAACRAMRERGQPTVLHELAIALARHAGVEPDLDRWSELERALLFGPLSAVSFRLNGPDSMDNASERVRAAAAAFGAISSPTFTPEEAGLRQMVRPSAMPIAA